MCYNTNVIITIPALYGAAFRFGGPKMKKSRKKKSGAARPGQPVRADSEPVRKSDAPVSPAEQSDAPASHDKPSDVSASADKLSDLPLSPDKPSGVPVPDPSADDEPSDAPASPDKPPDVLLSPDKQSDVLLSPDKPSGVPFPDPSADDEPSDVSASPKYPPIHHDNPFIPDFTEDLSGLKIRSINLVVIAAAAILLALFLSSSFLTSVSYQNLQDANNKYIAAELAANQLKHASYYLTTQVRMFAVTQDTKYMDRYFEEALVKRNREQANDTLKTNLPDNYAYIYLDEAYRYSRELMKREYRAMRLVIEACNYLPGGDAASILNDVNLTENELAMSAEEKILTAINLTHDAYYQRYTDLIEERVNSCIRCVTEERVQAEKENADILNEQAFAQRAFAICLMLITVVTIVAVMNLVMWPMNAFVNCIRHYQIP